MTSDKGCGKSTLLFESRSALYTVVKYCRMKDIARKKWLLLLPVLFVATNNNAQIPAGTQPGPVKEVH
jgi:hypothetical protein